MPLLSIDVMKVTWRVVAELYPMLCEKRIAIETNSCKDLLPYSIERSHLEIILQNLMSTSAKFTPQNGLISIDQSIDDASLNLILNDNGSGINESDLS